MIEDKRCPDMASLRSILEKVFGRTFSKRKKGLTVARKPLILLELIRIELTTSRVRF